MTPRLLAVGLAIVIAAATVLFAPMRPAASQSTEEAIDVQLSLSDAVELDATVTAEPTIDDDALILEGAIEGTATVLGDAATIDSQPFTLTATTTCGKGEGTLTLSTSSIVATVDGTDVTIEDTTVTVSASCGRTPTLDVTADALTASFSDDTTVSTSECSLSVSSRSNTTLGTAICDIKELICDLASIVDDDGSVEDAVQLLERILADVDDTI